MPARIFIKSAAGRAALTDRSVAGRARTALILVNGQDSIDALRAKLGPDAAVLIGELQARGLVEPLQPVAAPVRGPVAEAPAPPPPSPPPEDESGRLAPLKREVLVRLRPHFGPDVPIVAATLLAATDAVAYRAALGKIEARLALYLGKARAAQLLADLRG